MSKRIHIIKRGAGWAVKTEGAKRASKIYASKVEAEGAVQVFRRQGYDVVVHKSNGFIQKWQKAK